MRLDPRTAAVLTATVLASIVVVLGAAEGGSWQLEDRTYEPGPARGPLFEVPRPEGDPAPIDAAPPPGATAIDWGPAEVVGWILLGIGAAAGLWWLWRRLRERALLRPDALGATGAAGVAAEAEPQLPVLRRGVAEARRYLASIAGPTDAVIAAWTALEEAATASGVRRAPAQTPTEFTVDVLERTAADPDATAELLGLYHRARFATDPIGVDEVARASTCLGRLAASWDALERSRRSGS